MNKKEETTNSYIRNATTLAKKFDSMKPRIDDIKRAFSMCRVNNAHVLEIGCGTGRDASEIIKLTDRYTGIDIADKLLEFAKENVPSGNFLVADLETYDLPDELDIIFAFASLLHSPKEEISKFLLKSTKALKKDGIVYISLKFKDDYSNETQTTEFGTRTYYYYNPELIEKLAGEYYSTEYSNIYDFNGQKWFTIVLRKR